MSETTNVFTDLGEGPHVYKEFQDIGIITGPRTRPRMLDKGKQGFLLGLHDPAWASQVPQGSGAETYYAQIVPTFSGLIDPDSNNLQGVPTTENTTKGTTFYFDPFPDGYACDGYEIWAGTVSGTLYLQGTLSGRFITTFTVGVTWDAVASGAVLDPLVIGPPAFASLVSVYQAEGEINSRTVLAGGKKYTDGYAQVASSASAPILTCGEAGSATFGDWEAKTDGSFRMRLDSNVHDFVDIDFTGDASMANVATTLQTAIRAAQDPKLISGSGVETTIATWAAITDGSFNIKVNGVSYDIASLNFSGDASMADVASTLQTALQSGISSNLTCTWDSSASRLIIEGFDDLGEDIITNGTFAADSDWTKGTNWSIAGGEAVSLGVLNGIDGAILVQDTDVDLRGKTWAITFDYKVVAFTGTASLWCTLGFAGDHFGAANTPAFIGEETVLNKDGSWHSISLEFKAADYASAVDEIAFVFRTSATSGGDLRLDNVTLSEDSGVANALGYCARHSSETGTDVSQLMAMRPDSTDVVLNRYGKDATTETVAWSTDHFVITGSSTGSSKRLSFLSSVSADVGTDISGASWLAGLESTDAIYTPGQTAKRSVIGEGTDWGDWATGMNFTGKGEADEFLIDEVRSATEIVLDEDYSGDLFDGNKEYALEPFDAQVYQSKLGNPFGYLLDNIQKIPVEKSEGITTLKNSGPYTAIMLQESSWILDSVDITSPLQVSPVDGCPNNDAAIEYENSVVFYSGDDFKVLRGRNIDTIDPEDRMASIIGRISAYAPEPRGAYFQDKRGGVLVWMVGLDNSRVRNTGICWNPKTGAWWLWNMKDANCVTALKDAAGKSYLATGDTYDDAHSVPAFVKLYSRDYFNDGASQSSTNTKQGTIPTGGIGSPTTTAGFLTCGSAFSSTFSDWTGITDGYFKITIDDIDLDVGPCDFSGAGDMDDIAAVVQVAIRSATNAGGAELAVWDTDHFVITSGTATNRSTVDYMRPYYPTVSVTDLSSVTFMNGRVDIATKTWAQNHLTLTLRNWDDDTNAVLSTTNDGEKDVRLAFCTADGQNLQYALITSNTSNTVTITPVPSSTPEGGWRWFLGGIVPTWYKWFDFGSPQHLQKLVAFAFTTNPNVASDRNYLHMLYYHDLKTTLRRSYTQQLGTSNDTVNTIEFKEREATQHGVKFIRPSSEHDLNVEDITITHHPLT